MKKQKTPKTGDRYAGTPPVQHSEVVLAQREPLIPPEKSAQSINEDDIEADRHNGSGGAFEATENHVGPSVEPSQRLWEHDEE
jgi:hypothetical protein